jgi:multimeric flavodoxin WrbA
MRDDWSKKDAEKIICPNYGHDTMKINRKRILGIIGSPRRKGNTEILVDEVMCGAEEGGAQVEKVVLNKLNIAPCRACNTCLKTGRCIQQDDMQPLLEQMQRHHIWVLGTPVYWQGPTAQFKTFLDRWYGQGQVVTFKGRRVILTIPLGAPDASVARHTVGMLEGALAHIEMKLYATILAPGVWNTGAVRKHPDVLAAARRAGRKAIEEIAL